MGFLDLVVLIVPLGLPISIFPLLVLWETARRAGVKLKLSRLVATHMQRVPPRKILLPLIMAAKAGVSVT
ncbi:MAG TPA: hypothetical protein GXX57_03320 [Firmicutes bacterium]|nr:hypothetical protein [Bacillota bacterium]